MLMTSEIFDHLKAVYMDRRDFCYSISFRQIAQVASVRKSKRKMLWLLLHFSSTNSQEREKKKENKVKITEGTSGKLLLSATM